MYQASRWRCKMALSRETHWLFFFFLFFPPHTFTSQLNSYGVSWTVGGFLNKLWPQIPSLLTPGYVDAFNFIARRGQHPLSRFRWRKKINCKKAINSAAVLPRFWCGFIDPHRTEWKPKQKSTPHLRRTEPHRTECFCNDKNRNKNRGSALNRENP